jgi:hypothetical protein
MKSILLKINILLFFILLFSCNSSKENQEEAVKNVLSLTYPEFSAKPSPKEFKEKIEPIVNAINAEISNLIPVEKKIILTNEKKETPVTVWFANDSKPVKIKMAVANESGNFNDNLEYYFIDGKLFFLDAIMAKYVFKTDYLKFWLDENYNINSIENRDFKNREKNIIQNVYLMVSEAVVQLEAKDLKQSKTSNQLEGKWQSLNDANSILVFQNNHKIEIYNEKEIANSIYILSNKCQNKSNSTNEKETEKYITVENDDLCFYILKLDETYLELMHLERGETLRFKRIK